MAFRVVVVELHHHRVSVWIIEEAGRVLPAFTLTIFKVLLEQALNVSGYGV